MKKNIKKSPKPPIENGNRINERLFGENQEVENLVLRLNYR